MNLNPDHFYKLYSRVLESNTIEESYFHIEQIGKLISDSKDFYEKIILVDRNKYLEKLEMLLIELNNLIDTDIKPKFEAIKELERSNIRFGLLLDLQRIINGDRTILNNELNSETTLLYRLVEFHKFLINVFNKSSDPQEKDYALEVNKILFENKLNDKDSNYSMLYEDINLELKKITKNREFQLWYGAGMIYFYYKVKNELLDLEEMKKFFYPAIQEHGITQDIRNELNMPYSINFENHKAYFNNKKFLLYLKQLSYYLDDNSGVDDPVITEGFYKFDNENGLLNICDRIIKIKSNTKLKDYISVISKSNKIWNYSELSEKINDSFEDFDDKTEDSMRGQFKKLTKRIEKVGIKDFFIKTHHTIGISTNYKKLK